MSTLEIVTLAAVAVVLLAWYLTYTAARLHRLHTRVEGALAALDAQLVRRADCAVELANSGVLDPATAFIVADAAADCLDAAADALTGLDWVESGLAEREATESALTRALALAVEACRPVVEGVAQRHDSSGLEGLEGLAGSTSRQVPCDESGESQLALAREELRRVESAAVRVHLARRFYNDAVVDVRRLRADPFVRAFRLAGYAQLPRTVEFEDVLPTAFGPGRWSSDSSEATP